MREREGEGEEGVGGDEVERRGGLGVGGDEGEGRGRGGGCRREGMGVHPPLASDGVTPHPQRPLRVGRCQVMKPPE